MGLVTGKNKKKLLMSLLISLAIVTVSVDAAQANTNAFTPTLTKLHNQNSSYPQSVYSVTNGTATDYNFITTSYDNNSNPITNYYKINFDLNGISPDCLTWTEVKSLEDNTITVNLPNNETKYLKYTYIPNEGYSAITGNGLIILKDDKPFYYIGRYMGNSRINNINPTATIYADFINTYTTGFSAAAYGNIIVNKSTINNIIGHFIGNHGTLAGGVIDNLNGTIGNIVADFISNYYSGDGAAIYNTGNINLIMGDFISNYSSDKNIGEAGGMSGDGGAIYNANNIDKISGNFIGNHSSIYGYGGAIYNKGTISSIDGIFTDNYSQTKSNSFKAYGGAIFNGKSTSGYNANSKITLSNTVFDSNYIDNNGTIVPNSIYNAGIINIADGATVTVKDGYDGLAEAKLNVGSGSIFNLNVDNNYIQNDNLGIITNNGTINWNLDVNLSGTGSADTILANNSQENISNIIVNNINIMNGNSATQDDYIIRILKTDNNALQLALSEELARKDIPIKSTTIGDYEDEIKGNAKWNDKFEKYTLNKSVIGNVTLNTTTTTNDSIHLTTTTQSTKTNIESLGDTLALVNQLDTADDRSFTFDTATDKYNATSDLGVTSAGNLSINGVYASTPAPNRSEINLNDHDGFVLNKATTLNINNTRLTGNNNIVTVNNQDAVVNLQNANLNGSITSNNGYTLNINGNTSDQTIINGGVGKASATHNGGDIKFNTDTFKDAEFSTLSGSVDLVTGQVENYDIGKLTSDANTNWKFEVDSAGTGADTLTVGNGSSGKVTVSEVNFINGDSASNEFTVKVLNTQDDNIQLEVTPTLAEKNQEIGTITKTSQDTVTPTVKWNEEFHTFTQNGINYGNINVATTDTKNDSLQIKITNTEWDEDIIEGSMGDTLALVSQLEKEENRNFNFDTANDVYEVKSDLGTTAAGTMNVNGVYDSASNCRSTINGNNYNMFVLNNSTKLNLNNVRVMGANSVASGTNESAVINMNNVELKNNASGITTAGSVNISGKSIFENNGNGIEVTDEKSIITLNGIDGDGYDVIFKDNLKGVNGAKLNLKAGEVEFHKPVSNLDINMDGTMANLKADNVFNGQNLTVASASNISMINNSVGTMQLNNLTLNDNMNLGVDVDLANKSMDRISANTYNLGDNKININNMNLVSDAKDVRTNIEFADENLRNNVTTSVSQVAYSPVYKYGVKYDSNNGEFQFARSGGDGNPTYSNLNPSVMTSPVAAQLGGYAGMLDNYSNALKQMDMFMLKSAKLRAAELKANKYAIAEGSPTKYYTNETNTTGIWVRPYTSYDSVGLKNGPKVNNWSYGSFVGGDLGMHDFGNGLYGEFSPYISYQGAHQHYSGNSIYQNGASLGFTGVLYKGNFFTGITAGVGANISEASTMFGNEDFPMLTTGVASKTGYNIEFNNGKFIIQPNLLASYTFVNTFNYKNASGVSIDAVPLHAVQINPNIRFSFNTKNYWQPYAFVGMNWNIMNNSGHFLANDTVLPELGVKPYIQYGLGIQKLFGDNFTAFAQVAIRNGGRNGVGGTLGLKWLLGGQGYSQQKEETKQNNSL